MNQPVPDELISAYFDGEVTPEERGQVEQLLESSTELRQLLEDTSKLSALLHSFPRETTPAELAVNVQKRVERTTVSAPLPLPKRRSLRREWSAFGVGVIATIASLVVFSVFLNPSQMNIEDESRTSSRHSLEALRRHSETDDKTKVAIASTGYEAVLPSANAPRDSATDGVSALGAFKDSVAKTAPGEAESLLSDETARYFPNDSIEESPSPEEFLRSLKNGDIFVRVDPDNTVAVVQLTVVDIYKGAEELKLLLQKRHLPAVEDDEAVVDMAKEEASALARKKDQKAAADDLVVMFVRAPGAQLASTIEESLNEHPKIYRKLATQRPMDLPVGQVVDSVGIASRDAKSGSSTPAKPSNGPEGLNEPQTVAVEANLSVNLFADLNGMTLDEPQKLEAKQQKKKSSSIATAKGKMESSGADAIRPGKADELPSTEKKVASAKTTGDAVNATPDSTKSSGYATFHLATNSQRSLSRLPVQQGRNAIQNSIKTNELSAVTNPMSQANSQMTPFGNSYAFSQLQGQGNFRRAGRANPDGRDPRLMRMLIVLKTEQPNPATTP